MIAIALRKHGNKGGRLMAGMSIFHWVIVIAVLVLYFIPVVKILNKAGYSGWWSLVILIPLVNIIMFYVFAFADWPALRGKAAS
jgi:uncharacterized membrane protein YhaH (DUF805 family)